MNKYCKGECVVKSKCYFYSEDNSDYCKIHSKNVDNCPICLSEMKLYSCEKIVFNKNIPYELNCGHIFHYKCVEQMFLSGRTPKCPMCRTTLSDDPMYIQLKNLEHNIKEQERYSTSVLLDIQSSQRRSESNGRRLLDALLGLNPRDNVQEEPNHPDSSSVLT